MPVTINEGSQSQPPISHDDFIGLDMGDFDGVVYTNDDGFRFIGVYCDARPRTLMKVDEDGTILLRADQLGGYFPIRKAPEGLTVTFSN